MGRHFLQIPGPSPEPDAVMRAISATTIDHRGPEFQQLGLRVLEAVKPVFGTTNPVIIYSSSGTGAWEGALTNTLSPGDAVLFYETGHFASLWIEMATRLGLKPRSSTRTGGTASTPRPSAAGSPTIPGTRSRPSAACTTRPPPA